MPLLSISLVVVLILVVLMGAKVVPQQTAYIVERLGKYHSTMSPGLNIIIPFVDRIAYKHTLKEVAADIPEQVCITTDTVQVAVDGVVFYQVMEPKWASYGISNFMFAVAQLSQTTMRSEIGKIVLDKCFEERGNINVAVVAAIDEAASLCFPELCATSCEAPASFPAPPASMTMPELTSAIISRS